MSTTGSETPTSQEAVVRRPTLAAVIAKKLACTEDDLRELGAFLKAKGRAAKPSPKAARLMFGGEVVNALFDIEAAPALTPAPQPEGQVMDGEAKSIALRALKGGEANG